MNSQQGLSTQEAFQRLQRFGPNSLVEAPRPSRLSIFFDQLKNPLVYVLIFAGLVSALMRHTSDAIIIGVAILINTVLGFIQENRAGNALRALKEFLIPHAQVIRDGKLQEIKTAFIVPGDVVILQPGMRVPADGILQEANRLNLEEAILTGESLPVAKKKEDPVYMGTWTASGQGVFHVTDTGPRTKMGLIAKEIQSESEDTPLKKELTAFSKALVILVVSLSAVVFLEGLLSGGNWVDVFTTSVALAVSSIPEGLIVSLTVILAIGMQRILKRKGLVRNLASAETLGGVTVICADKTGTLTEGKLSLAQALGDPREMALHMVLANDLDDPLVIAAFDWAKPLAPSDADKRYERLDSIPFSSEERFFASLHRWEGPRHRMFVNGAPDFLLRWCDMDEERKQQMEKLVEELSAQGHRLMALAKKEVPSNIQKLEIDMAKKNLTWVGLLAFSDGIRSGVKRSLEEAREAGIKIIVITGDSAGTAAHVLKQLGIPVKKEEIVLGEEVDRCSAIELAGRLKTAKLFARTAPGQKLKIISALKENEEVVAMMGDGVNDAPALHRADIGIVVHQASDVAKETADLVLLDSNFATIIAAVEEGRAIFDNIRKVILYLLCDAFEEIALVLGAILLGWPLPVTAVQILWVNLISDGFPGLALTVEPAQDGIMKQKPRGYSERLVTPFMMALIAVISLVGGVLALGYFALILNRTGDLILARSAIFVTLGINSLVFIFSIRTLNTPFRPKAIFGNPSLLLAVLAGLGLQIIPFLTEGTRKFFGLSDLPALYWAVSFGFALILFTIVETWKWLSYHSSRRPKA